MKLIQASEGVFSFRCPGCGRWHMIPTKKVAWCEPTWHFNGDMEQPTFVPEVNIFFNKTDGEMYHCKFNIMNGRIQFYEDCTHEHKGEIMDLPTVEPLRITN